MTDRTKAPEVRDFDNVTLDIPQCETLPNGVELTVINYGEVEVCQVDVYIKGGFLHESQPGLVTFVAKMLNKGTTDYSVDQIAEQFDYYGTELALADSGVAISASLKTTNRNLPQVLPLMYDCITKSTFPQDMLEKAKEKAIADLAVMRERVSYLARRKLVQLLVGESHPMAKSADDERVKDITRDNLLDYHRRYFVPGNCIVVVSGKISSAELDLVRNIFGSWESRTVERRDEIPECPQPSMFGSAKGRCRAEFGADINRCSAPHPPRLHKIANTHHSIWRLLWQSLDEKHTRGKRLYLWHTELYIGPSQSRTHRDKHPVRHSVHCSRNRRNKARDANAPRAAHWRR